MDEKMSKLLRGMWDSLSDGQREQAKRCKTMDELAALAAKEGMELPDEALDMVAGGAGGCDDESELSEENDKEQTAQTIRLIPL